MFDTQTICETFAGHRATDVWQQTSQRVSFITQLWRYSIYVSVCKTHAGAEVLIRQHARRVVKITGLNPHYMLLHPLLHSPSQTLRSTSATPIRSTPHRALRIFSTSVRSYLIRSDRWPLLLLLLLLLHHTCGRVGPLLSKEGAAARRG